MSRFWDSILGASLAEALEQQPEKRLIPACMKPDAGFLSYKNFLGQMHGALAGDRCKNIPLPETEPFAPLFRFILDSFLEWKHPEWNRFLGLENPKSALPGILYSRIQEIPMRAAIHEMRKLKQQGCLKGGSAEAEYRHFCQAYLSDPEYDRDFCGKYPEMLRLLYVRLDFTYRYLLEFLEHFRQDRQQLEEGLCGGPVRFLKEVRLGGSDSHCGGRTVIRCVTDGGTELIYKPHSLKKDEIYQNLFGELCRRTGLTAFFCRVLDRGSYGWSQYLRHAPCADREGAGRYYERMGIHLFLCMLLNGSDMHRENILAVGEYPVILDMETLPGVREKRPAKTPEDLAEERVRESVLRPGILPVPSWQTEGQAVILNALHPEQEARTSVKIPVIVRPCTSEMDVEYHSVPVRQGESLPVFQGRVQAPAQHLESLCRGFQKAYACWLDHGPELEPLTKGFWDCPVRFLTRHTQQYAMYLFTSLHPVFLSSTEARVQMLQVLQKKELDRQLLQEELDSLFRLDVPLFVCGGREEPPGYGTSAQALYQERKARCGKEDMERQLSLIRLSVRMSDERYCHNRYFEERPAPARERMPAEPGLLKQALEQIRASVREKAVMEDGSITWLTMQSDAGTCWHMRPADLSFYEGVGGIAVFLAFMERLGFAGDRELLELAAARLAAHMEASERHTEGKTGLYVGEGSLAYAFLCLYRITGQKRFADLARRQAEGLRRLYQKDQEYDLLSGNAGAVALLTKMYETLGERIWLNLAEEIGEFLWSRAEKQEGGGTGWPCRDSGRALAGMAHGASGFLMAYAALLEHTGDARYVRMLQEILAFEDSLYVPEAGNWRDLRYPDREAYANAWCHGAAGILLSRLRLAGLKAFRDNPAVRQDLEQAARVLFARSWRDGLCLCHGMSGNCWIMETYLEAKEAAGIWPRDEEPERLEQEKETAAAMKREIIRRAARREDLLPQDEGQPGLMAGAAGIGLFLGRQLEAESIQMRKKPQIPEKGML